MTAERLAVKGLIVRRGNFIVGPVDLHLPAGTVGVVVGDNGSGKSTLLLALAGLITVEEGIVTLDGSIVEGAGSRVDPWRRGIAILQQSSGLWPHLSLRQQCRLVAGSDGFDGAGITACADRLALVDLLDRKPTDLSGGEAQRGELLRTLASGARLILADEPFSGQHPAGVEKMEDEFRRATAAGRSVLIASHRDDGDRVLLRLGGPRRQDREFSSPGP